jgi:hypothetical protein
VRTAVAIVTHASVASGTTDIQVKECRSAGCTQEPDSHRHIGLVVDDLEAARQSLEEAGARILPGRGLDFLDPWGNHFQVVEYRQIQFTKAPEIARGMGLELDKSPEALEELREKGLG